MTRGPIRVIFGCAAPWSTLPLEEAGKFLPVLDKHHVEEVDTAHIYFGSEKTLGKLKVPSKYIVHTKAPGLTPGGLSRQSISKALEQSLTELGVDSVETYFLHSPDLETPISETMDAINEHYKAGKFRKFGVSNFTAAQLQDLVEYAQSRGYVLPTVYEGAYSPITRHLEEGVIPLARKLGMTIFAYSSLAGGFLTKSPATILEAKELRWNVDTRVGAMAQKLYNRPQLLEALGEWAAISDEHGISKAALAYRWVAYHSQLSADFSDAIIVGASRPDQLDDTITSLGQGPLPAAAVERVERIWAQVREYAPVDYVHM